MANLIDTSDEDSIGVGASLDEAALLALTEAANQAGIHAVFSKFNRAVSTLSRMVENRRRVDFSPCALMYKSYADLQRKSEGTAADPIAWSGHKLRKLTVDLANTAWSRPSSSPTPSPLAGVREAHAATPLAPASSNADALPTPRIMFTSDIAQWLRQAHADWEANDLPPAGSTTTRKGALPPT
jgi:hypothetical protein